MNEKKDARSHYVADECCPVVDRLAGLHGGIRVVVPGGNEIEVEFGDRSVAIVTGPMDYTLTRPTLASLIDDGERMVASPDVPVDGLTVAYERLGAAIRLIERCDDATSEKQEFAAIDLAAKLAKLSHETLTS